MIPAIDLRDSLPSISQFERLALCPPSWRLGQQVPEPPASSEAQYGDEIHRAKETGETENLTNDQRDLVDEMSEQEENLIKEVMGLGVLKGDRREYREKRFWYWRQGLYHGEVVGEEKLFSGKLDYSTFVEGPERVSLYIDYKSLWGDTTPPAHNLQLRGGAVLMKQNFGSRRAFVAILQPTKRKIAIAAEYGPEELEQAERECVKIVKTAIRMPESVDIIAGFDSLDKFATPGPEQCRYCRAKLVCKVAYRESVGELSTTGTATSLNPIYVDDDRLDRLGRAWEVAQIIGKAIDAEIRRRKEENPNSMPNYRFVSSGHTSEIASPALVWPKFSNILRQEEFAAACTVAKGKLEKAVQNATGQKMSHCKRLVELMLSDLLVHKPKKMSLERKPYYEIKP